MKEIISFTIDGSTGLSNIEFIVKALKNKFKFKISQYTVTTGTYKYICEISADCKSDVDRESLIKEVMGYASHAVLMD